MVHFYFKYNSDWKHEHKCKYGYVEGNNNDNLINRLLANTEEYSNLSYFQGVWQIEITSNYKLPYKEIDKIFSILARNTMKIRRIEQRYNITLPKLLELNQFLVEGRVRNEFIYKNGISLINTIINEEFPKLGLHLVKTYTQEELDDINSASKLKYKDNGVDVDDNDDFLEDP